MGQSCRYSKGGDFINLHLRFLAAKLAIFTAIAGLMNPLSPEWDEVYKRRLFIEMRLNIETEKWNEQKTGKEVLSGADTISAGLKTAEERTVVWAEERMAVSESQAEDEVSGEITAGTAVDVSGEQPVASPEDQTTNPGTQQVDVRPDPVSVGISGAPLYQIDGDTLDPGVADYLYRRLCEAGIGYFYEFSVCLAYQESSFNPLAENPNGRDKGLFQFRVEFHPGLDWRNPYQQVDLYVQMMANRAVAGCDPYMMVSRHNTSDYCPEFNGVYVGQILQHLPKLRRVK